MVLRAFIVEDNVSLRESLREALLELTGIETAAMAGTQQTAVAWLGVNGNAWDIAIVDLNLGAGGSGFAVLKACHARKPEQKVVVLTGRAKADVRQQCLELGADSVFDKAIETDALMDWCRSMAEGAR